MGNNKESDENKTVKNEKVLNQSDDTVYNNSSNDTVYNNSSNNTVYNNSPNSTVMNKDSNNSNNRSYTTKSDSFSKITLENNHMKSGGFAVVYKGIDENGVEYAVKIPDIFSDPYEPPLMIKKKIYSFKRESDLMLKLTHPNIIKTTVYTSAKNIIKNVREITGCEDDIDCLVMEYSSEGTLQEILDKNYSVNVYKAIDITLQLLSALEYMENVDISIRTDSAQVRTTGIVHRDIAPKNILSFNNHSVFKLGDFGLAKTWRTTGQTEGELTDDGSPGIGTPGYRSYLQLIDYKNAKPFYDLWSCIATLYKLLTGEKTRDKSIEENIKKSGYIPIVSLADRKPSIFRGWNPSLKKELIEYVDLILMEESHLEDGYRFTTAKEAKNKLLNIRNRYFDKNGNAIVGNITKYNSIKKPSYNKEKESTQRVNPAKQRIEENKYNNTKNTSSGRKVAIGFFLLIVVAIFILVSLKMKGCSSGCGKGNESVEYTSNSFSETKKQTAIAKNYVKDKWLTSITPGEADENFCIDEETNTSNSGVEYSHRMYAQEPFQEASFFLNGEYNRLKGMWCICEGSESDQNKNSFAILADGVEVYKSPVVNSGELPHDLFVNIGDCKILTIQFREGEGALELGNLKLTNKDKKEKKESSNNGTIVYPNWLTQESVLRTDSGISIEDYAEETNTGETFSHFIGSNEPGSVEFYLNGKYGSLTGIWGIVDYMKDDVEKESFEIYADNKRVFKSCTLKKGDTPERVFALLNNCKKLKIVFTNTTQAAEFGNVRLNP